jgi:hypothetical protein
MALVRKPFFYTEELKRVIVQLLACFSGYQVKTGIQHDGQIQFLDVPMIWGDASKVGAFILRGGSDNSMNYVPCGALTMPNLEREDDLRHIPFHSEKINYIERAMNGDGLPIAGVPGVKKTMERFMPVPYKMEIEVEFWCSNQDQQFQLMEQIAALYAVDMDYLISNSPTDWTNIRSLAWSGKFNMGISTLADASGKMDPYYTVMMPFVARVWIGLPVKVYDTKYIEVIKVPIYQLNADIDWDTMPQLDELVIRATPENIIRFSNLEAVPLPTPEDDPLDDPQ